MVFYRRNKPVKAKKIENDESPTTPESACTAACMVSNYIYLSSQREFYGGREWDIGGERERGESILGEGIRVHEFGQRQLRVFVT